MLKQVLLIFFLLNPLLLFGCQKDFAEKKTNIYSDNVVIDSLENFDLPKNQKKVLEVAMKTLADKYEYDMTMGYYTMPFPGGDIDPHIGVCTDVVVRALRLGNVVDLQKALNEDIKKNKAAYNLKNWKVSKADPNIDHRRVMNLKTWFERHWKEMNKEDFQPGDIVIWDMNQDGISDHIGIISDNFANENLKVIHNHPDPGYVAEEDKLFRWKITGHFRINE